MTGRWENEMDLRKLDALVAEHVMGFKIHTFEIKKDHTTVWVKEPNGTPLLQPPEKFTVYQYSTDLSGYPRHTVAEYSTDIAAAWEVFKKLRQIAPKEAKEMYADPTLMEMSDGEYWCGYTWHEWSGHGAKAETAQMAICLAALKTKGIDVSEWEK